MTTFQKKKATPPTLKFQVREQALQPMCVRTDKTAKEPNTDSAYNVESKIITHCYTFFSSSSKQHQQLARS